MKRNPDYISIGKVSKEKNVTIKALRYYDSIGVFRPAYVDKVTNYRYYDRSKLYILDAILLCVELGIPLKKFEKYKKDDDEFDLRQLLYDGKSHGEQKIADIRKRLGTLSKTIALIEGDTAGIVADTVAGSIKKTAKKLEKLDDDKIPEEKAMVDVSAAAKENTVTEPNVDSMKEKSIETNDVQEEPAQIEKKAAQESISSVEAWEKKHFENRGILTAPLEGGAADSKKILRLNMVAQLLGMTASYPAGRLYEYDEEGRLTAYAYILVDGYEQCEDKRLKILPKGEYYCRQGQKLQESELVPKTSELVKDYRNLTIVESDLVGSDNVELQIFR